MISCRCTLVCWLAADLKLGQSVTVGYDPDLGREKLAFEKAKWEAEMEARRAEAEERKA